MADSRDLSDQAVDAAKQLALWRSGIPWWVVLVVLIEGVVVCIISLLVVLDPSQANVNMTLALGAGLVVAGPMQSWDISRDTVPEKIDSALAEQAVIAVYAGPLMTR